MKLKKFLCLPACVAIISLGFSAQADELSMKSAGDSHSGINKPARGLNMDTVLQSYGEPAQRRAAIGEPPITRWEYGDFTVYFEHQYVIHSVTHR